MSEIFVSAFEGLWLLSLIQTVICICGIGLAHAFERSEAAKISAEYRAPSAKKSPFRPGSAPEINAGCGTGARGGCSGSLFTDDVDLKQKLRWIRRVMAATPRKVRRA